MRVDPAMKSGAIAFVGWAHPSRRWWPWRFPWKMEMAPGLCETRGFIRKEIVVGPAFSRFAPREQQAILLHEVGHVKLRHIEKRILNLWRIFFWPSSFVRLCFVQEFQADAFCAGCGYGVDLALAMSRMKTDDRVSLHPSLNDRMARLLACSKG